MGTNGILNGSLAAALMAATPVAAQDGAPLSLICGGAGQASKPTVGNVWGSNSNGTTAQATVVGREHVGFDDQVSLRLNGAQGQIRMPRAMLPTIRGGKDGWFELHDVEVEEGEIRATVAVSILNKPKLRLDRYTGAISISGKSGDYTGQCQPFDPQTVERKF